MTLTTKFKKDLQTLREASNGAYYLDVRNTKLYTKKSKVYKQMIFF